MKRAASGAAVLAVFVLLVAACGGGSKKSEEGETEGGKATVAGVSANDHGSKEVSDEAEVELDDFYFEPTVLKGKAGSTVKLELKNEGGVEHNFTIDSQQIDQDVEAGEDAEVTVTIPASGELSFYCKYHKSMGMAGALEPSG
jgi:plastocyanin